MATWATVTLNDNGGSGSSPSAFYYHTTSPVGYYKSKSATTSNIIYKLTKLPTKKGYTYKGHYDTPSGGAGAYVNYQGKVQQGFPSTTSDFTIYARWTPSTYTMAFNAGIGGSVSPTSKSVTYDSAVGDLPTPTKPDARFLGWFTQEVGGTQVTSQTVYRTDDNTTVYAHWEDAHTLTFDPNGGEVTPTTRSIFTGDAIGELPTPTRSGYHFDGWYTAGTGGSQVTAATKYTWTSDVAIFAHWTKKPVLTFNPNGGEVTETTRVCWYGEALGALPRPTKDGYFFDGWFDDIAGGSLITAETTYDWQDDATIYAHWTEDEQYRITFDPNGGITPEYERVVRPGDVVENLPTPTLAKNTFGGWWTARTGGVRFNDGDTFDLHADLTLYAHWTRTEYTITFNAAGGTPSFETKDVTVNQAVGALPTCEKYANEFLGWFDAAQGGTQWTAATVFTQTNDIELYAHWSVDPTFLRTLTLNADGGTPATQTVQCTYGLEIGTLPGVTKAGKKFFGWFYSGQEITPTTVCNWSGSRTATARWVDSIFGNVVDYFGLASASLRPISSDSGDNRQRICVNHTGKWEPGVGETSGVWRNPTVTYQVVKDCTLNITLGSAYAGGGNTSGYMITGVKVSTAVGKFPTVTVTATANEGANAINQFPFAVSLLGRARAQNLLNAVVGGGQIQSCRLQASCTPVVVEENNMPCASDVVGGRIVATASTYAPNNESAPGAGNGFVEVGAPKQCGDKDYIIWNIKAERDM